MRHVKLQIRGLTATYRTARGTITALNGIDLDVREGEKVVILGPSGCGKSTLLKIVAGFERAAAGSVCVDGLPVSGPGPDRAFVFQEFDQLFPWLTVSGNLSFALRVARGVTGREAERAIDEVLSLVGLSRWRDLYPHQLSGGMKMRVAIARALVLNPAVLLMDEPFAALDAQSRSLLQAEVNRMLAETGQTLLFVTHSIEEALVLGDRIVVLSASPGRVRQIIEPAVTGVTLLERTEGAELRRVIRQLLEQERVAGEMAS
ncbi:ABC transporter ATP-binding protein [Symbiobacterium thermophilum]|uniref:ABC transporter ATP-binding protein n=1 Tax=Symbiobacterium thermophilum TaxID=2734 RepID=UPI0035C75985